jgi:hypothetical protein
MKHALSFAVRSKKMKVYTLKKQKDHVAGGVWLMEDFLQTNRSKVMGLLGRPNKGLPAAQQLRAHEKAQSAFIPDVYVGLGLQLH